MTFLIGLGAGLFGGLVGLGGGVIMIPLLVGFLGIDQHRAHGTSLVALVFTGISGALAYGMNGAVDWFAAALVAASAIPTARAGARSAHALPAWKLKRAFGGFLLFVTLLLLLKPFLPHSSGIQTLPVKIAFLLFTGAVTGFVSGMMGVGGGTIMVPALVLVLGFNQHLAQGSALLAMVPAGAAGALTHRKLGNVKASLLTGLIPGILIGSYTGGTLAHVLSEGLLRILFGLVLIVLGARYLKTAIPKMGAADPARD